MFVDASALVALVVQEPGADDLAARLEASLTPPVTSPLAVFETTLAAVRLTGLPIEHVTAVVQSLLASAGIRLVPIEADTVLTALDTHRRYGKGRGHPAQLNMGDCFAYAAARELGVRLLYKGDDFAATDLA